MKTLLFHRFINEWRIWNWRLLKCQHYGTKQYSDRAIIFPDIKVPCEMQRQNYTEFKTNLSNICENIQKGWIVRCWDFIANIKCLRLSVRYVLYAVLPNQHQSSTTVKRTRNLTHYITRRHRVSYWCVYAKC